MRMPGYSHLEAHWTLGQRSGQFILNTSHSGVTQTHILSKFYSKEVSFFKFVHKLHQQLNQREVCVYMCAYTKEHFSSTISVLLLLITTYIFSPVNYYHGGLK